MTLIQQTLYEEFLTHNLNKTEWEALNTSINDLYIQKREWTHDVTENNIYSSQTDRIMQ